MRLQNPNPPMRTSGYGPGMYIFICVFNSICVGVHGPCLLPQMYMYIAPVHVMRLHGNIATFYWLSALEMICRRNS